MAKSKPIEVDILDMEFQQALPHWLDPILKYSGTMDGRRKASQIEHANEIQAKAAKGRKAKQWQSARARSLRLLGFDPSEPRDDHGQWTSGGGGDEAGVPGYSPGVKGRGDVEVKARRAEWVEKSPVKTIDHIVAAAPVAQNAFAEAGRKIAAELGIEFKNPGEKTKDAKGVARTKEKIAERNGVAARVTDTARGSFILSKPEQADEVIHKLALTHEVVAEPWRTIKESHYTDRALLFRDRATGLIGEVQITEPRMAAAKKIGHKLYEEARSLPAGNPRVAELEAQMRAVYDPVLDSYKGTMWQAVDGRSRI